MLSRAEGDESAIQTMAPRDERSLLEKLSVKINLRNEEKGHTETKYGFVMSYVKRIR